ncbi:Scavenger receptor class B member 1 [Frankliniella fusca]|uniref:Scavenger receptor class B member 1 n=1 Tax=Frankliniella fusca TaxID=407009 RepID=A0AAE1LQB5_9NEOP|nr:Scavenger receptor class B member 1 [Frankliniella fusca]
MAPNPAPRLTRQITKQYMKVGQSAKNRLFGVAPQIFQRDNGSGDKRPLNMLVSERGRMSSVKLAIVVIGAFLLAVGILLSSVPWLDLIISKNLKLWNGTLAYSYWQRPGVIRLTKVWVFNMTNPDGFLNYGEKPRLQEIGPFVYREDMEKVNIAFHDNGTVTFQHRKILRFVPEMSVDRNTKIVLPNIPLLTLSTHVSSSFPLVQFVVSTGARTLGLKPFVSLTADQLLFGYDDTLVKLAHNLFPRHLRPQAQMGLLLGRNGTLDEVSTLHTGQEGMDKFGYIDTLNGRKDLPYWKSPPCNAITASEGSVWPPRAVTGSDTVAVYDKDLCRVLPLQRRGSSTENGILSDYYTPADDAFTPTTPENICFCENPDSPESCPPKGLQNIAPCQYEAPVYLSYPHFLNGDPSLAEAVEGLKADVAQHGTYFKIQPKLGVTISAKVRVQANLWVRNAAHVGAVSKFPTIVFPLMWLEEGVEELTPSILRWVYLATTVAETALPVATYAAIVLGLVLLAAVFVQSYRKVVFTKETLQKGREKLRRGSSFLVNGQHRLLILRDSYSLLNTTPEDTPDMDPDPGRDSP